MSQTKRCPRCLQTKEISEFSPNPSRHDKVCSYCRVCVRERYHEDKEKHLANKKEYWLKNKEKLKPKKAAWYLANSGIIAEERGTPEYRRRERDLRMQREFGISLKTVEEMKAHQNNLCGICEVDFDAPKIVMCVDHDHATGKVRKLLCRKCNAGLGLFRDELKIVAKAMEYLTEHKK